jgi:hypothetical protein
VKALLLIRKPKRPPFSLDDFTFAMSRLTRNSREFSKGGYSVGEKIGAKQNISESLVKPLFIPALYFLGQKNRSSGLQLRLLSRNGTKIPAVSPSDSGKQPK